VNDIGKLLGSLGAEVMAVLWSADEPLSVRTVLTGSTRTDPQLAYTTVMTVLSVHQRGLLHGLRGQNDRPTSRRNPMTTASCWRSTTTATAPAAGSDASATTIVTGTTVTSVLWID
jgi:hypothetical protein